MNNLQTATTRELIEELMTRTECGIVHIDGVADGGGVDSQWGPPLHILGIATHALSQIEGAVNGTEVDDGNLD